MLECVDIGLDEHIILVKRYSGERSFAAEVADAIKSNQKKITTLWQQQPAP